MTMTKRYISATVISLNIMYKGKYKRHLCFDAAACSGSSYTTPDEEEQKAIEAHPMYGKTFSPDPYYQQPVVADEDEEDAADDAVEFETVAVSSLTEARDYLAENFGVARTKLRSREAIINAASANHIQFTGV